MRQWRAGRKIEVRYRTNGWTGIPRDGLVVYQDVGGAVCGKFGCGDSEHVRVAAEAIREEEDVRVSMGRGRQGSKVVDTDRDARDIGQGYREDWPANCLAGGFTYPQFCAGFHANAPGGML